MPIQKSLRKCFALPPPENLRKKPMLLPPHQLLRKKPMLLPPHQLLRELLMRELLMRELLMRELLMRVFRMRAFLSLYSLLLVKIRLSCGTSSSCFGKIQPLLRLSVALMCNTLRS